jgi:hypothetical protein
MHGNHIDEEIYCEANGILEQFEECEKYFTQKTL